MAGKSTLFSKAYVADLPIYQYTGVVRGTQDGHATLPQVANQIPLGAVTNDEQMYAGYNVAVQLDGIAELVAAGAINYGDQVILASGGQALSASTLASGTLANVLGTAENTVVTGDHVFVLMRPYQYTVQ